MTPQNLQHSNAIIGGQSRVMSLAESLVNVTIGFAISLIANWLILPLFGVQTSMAQNAGIALSMTGISVLRSYLLRRAFNYWHLWGHR